MATLRDGLHLGEGEQVQKEQRFSPIFHRQWLCLQQALDKNLRKSKWGKSEDSYAMRVAEIVFSHLPAFALITFQTMHAHVHTFKRRKPTLPLPLLSIASRNRREYSVPSSATRMPHHYATSETSIPPADSHIAVIIQAYKM